MRQFNATCQGESHKATEKPCQDYSWSGSWDGVSMAVVCDGHGGARYFRSDVGSKLCAEITVEAVKQFVSTVDKTIFVGKPLTQRKAIDEMAFSDKLRPADNALRQLFSSIIVRWRDAITQHAQSTPLNQWEETHVEKKYLDDFKREYKLEKTYGCTLMAYVQTPNYWFAFHIGDGKCVAFSEEENLWSEPIPWDDRCFLNKTTSICDSDALNEFRYCYQGDGEYPVAVFLGSDGMDDSFGPMENLVDFYIQVVKSLAKSGDKVTQTSIVSDLPTLSKRGSQDDMSIAYIYDQEKIGDYANRLIRYQIDQTLALIKTLKNKQEDERKKYFDLRYATSRKDMIERDYAVKNMESLASKIATANHRLDIRVAELGFPKDDPQPPTHSHRRKKHRHNRRKRR